MRNAECRIGEGKDDWVERFKRRTKRFALDVIRLVEHLPRSRTADVIGRQLARASTSVGANYRAACRARSHAEFCAELGIVEEEADESAYWLELLIEAGIVSGSDAQDLVREANEILAVVVTSLNTARRNK